MAGATEPKPSSRETRKRAVPCAGTWLLIVPADSVRAPDQRSRSSTDLPARPAAAALVRIVRAESLSLKSATATSPLASGLAKTIAPSWSLTTFACLPKRILVERDDVPVDQDPHRLGGRLAQVGADEQRRGHDRPQAEVRAVLRVGHPAVADLEHVGVVPAARARRTGSSGAFCWMMLIMLAQLSLMSPVVRHRWPTSAPQVPGLLHAPLAERVDDRTARGLEGVTASPCSGRCSPAWCPGSRPGYRSCRTSGSRHPSPRTSARRRSRGRGCPGSRAQVSCRHSS